MELSARELDRVVAGLERPAVAEPAGIFFVSEPRPEPPPLPDGGSGDLLSAWERVQARFVDDPVGSVEGARRLVQEALHRFVEAAEARQRRLDEPWRGRADASTETLRQAMRGYHGLLERLAGVVLR